MDKLFEVSENYTIAGGLGEKTRIWSTSEEAVSLPFPPPVLPIWIQHTRYLDEGIWCLVREEFHRGSTRIPSLLLRVGKA